MRISLALLLVNGMFQIPGEVYGAEVPGPSAGIADEAPALRRKPINIAPGDGEVDGTLGGGDGVMFKLQIRPRSSTRAPIEFIAREGDDVMAEASRAASELGLQSREEALLKEAAKSYGQAARVLPLGELSLPLSGGRIAKLVVFDGDRAPDLRARLSAAGLTDDEVEPVLLEAMSQLRDEGLAAWMTTTAMVNGQEQHLSVFKDEDVKALVRRFAAQHALPDAEASALAEHVMSEAIKNRAVPMLAIPVRMPASRQAQQHPGEASSRELKVYSGENIREKVAAFSSLHGLPEEDAALLLKHALRAAARSGFVPFAKHLPDFSGRQGEKLPELRLWARDNITEAVREYAETHALEPPQEARVLAAVEKEARAKGVLPLLSVKVNLRRPGDPSSTGAAGPNSTVSFQLFEGDDLEEAVAGFALEFGLDDDERALLLSRASSEGQSKRVLPVLTAGRSTTFPIGPNGARVAVPVVLFDGDDPAVNAVAAAFSAGLDQTQAAELAVAVTDEARRARLAPAAILEVPGSDGRNLPAPLKLHFGDNVADEVSRYGDEFALGPSQRQELLRSATAVAMEAKMVPVLSVPIRVLKEEGGGTSEHQLELFRGEEVDAKVAAFARELGLDKPSTAKVREHVTATAVSEGLLPVLTLPLSNALSRELWLASVDVFKGDTPGSAVERLLQHGRDRGIPTTVSKETRDALVAEVEDAGKQRGVFPEIRLKATSVSRPGGGPVEVELYRGDDVAEVAKRAVASEGLEDSDREALEAEIRVAAIKARVVPAVRILVDLPGKEQMSEPLDLFSGDDIAAAADDFAAKVSLSPESLAVLKAEAMRRAQAARLVPVLSLPLEVTVGPAGEHRGATEQLEMFLGDNVTATVRAFISQHETDPSREQELIDFVYGAAVDNRLLPEFEVPVRANAADGQVAESLFALFRGDKLEEAAGKFAEGLGLGPAQLPALLRFLKDKIAATGGEAIRDEL